MEREVLQRWAAKLGVSTPGVIRNIIAGLAIMLENTLWLRCPFLLKGYFVKLSGLNRATYQRYLRSFESLLALQSNVGIREVAVQFSCLEAEKLASKILQRYESSLPEIQQVALDLSKPLFTTVALFTACRTLKLKVDKTKMVSVSGVKKTIFDRLHAQLEKISQQINREGDSLSMKLEEPQKSFLEDLAKEEAKVSRKRPKNEIEPTEDYEEWKRRILENAAKSQSNSV
ncbi:PREDICTED: LOW QUALITY PROTEIN: origin recognition complex subunit 6 [Thamnophis sirtalis]|uniref:Origin recognition complex subunit 6 n=1 Tax=Thamnophis sirtalis TaxID=35019 RepID=A0A6I9YX40_9SAUR|nr:PREDICTED: LOW QUALITY PROTEIN: origin recognition complex subunit 6 [Thamnophis sirtalis]